MRDTFRRAQSYFTILLTLEILMGLIIIIVTIVYQNLLIRFIADMERKVFLGQFINVYIFGVQLIVVNISGVFLWQRMWQYKYATTMQLFITAWVFLTFMIILNGIGTVCSLYKCANALQNSAEMSLRKGMDLYFESPEWKLLWDGLQFHKQCCGVRSYKDWMRASWILEARSANMQPEDESTNGGNDKNCEQFDNTQSGTQRNARSSSRENYSILAPFACCKQTSKLCYARYMPQIGAQRKNIPTLTENDINTNGCLPIFTQTMWLLLHLLFIFVILSFLINVGVCVFAHRIICKHLIGRQEPSDMNFFDDQGRPVLYLKYPPNISCVTINENSCGSVLKPFKTCKCCGTEECSQKSPTPCCCSKPASPSKICEFCGKIRRPTCEDHAYSDTELCKCADSNKCDLKKSASKLTLKLCEFCGKHKKQNDDTCKQEEPLSPCRCTRKYHNRILH